MKTKPLLITILCLTAACAGIFFYVHIHNPGKGNTKEIMVFMSKFDLDLQTANMDNLRNDFADSHNQKIKELINVLANKTSLGTKDSAVFKTTLNFDKMEVLSGNDDVAVVRVPLTFSHDEFNPQTSYIIFSVRRMGEDQYKFVKVKADVFAKDYLAYQGKIDERFSPPKPIEYSAITLASFKTAETLKGKYDSVMWFQHIEGQTYFYVVNGSFDRTFSFESQIEKDSAKTYKMGLLSPALKEIVPVEYDLVHNINGTFKGLIEVDKDDKHGFYTLDGKLVVPVEYDRVLPVNDGTHLAAIGKGVDFYWLNNDLSVSDKADIKIADILPQISDNLKINLTPTQTDIMEWNSREEQGSIYIPPSYLVDLNIMPKMESFENPLRKNTEDDDGDSETTAYNVDLEHNSGNRQITNLLETLFYDIQDHYIGGRGDLYQKKSLIVLDKQNNRLLSHNVNIEGGEDGATPSYCKDYTFKILNDSLFEVKVSASVYIYIPTDTTHHNNIDEMPAYHYFKIEKNKLVELNASRSFNFTKYVKMNESYLQGCYSYTIMNNKEKNGYKTLQADRLDPLYYQYLVNEIYAEYNYKFKDDKWNECFKYSIDHVRNAENDNVDDSLTAIDKYNITWLKQRMAAEKLGKNRLAMK